MIMSTEDASKKHCPMTLDGLAGPMSCRGSNCAAWRWVEVNVMDQQFIDTVRRVATEIGDKTPNRKEATALVVADRAAHGLPTTPTRGYCGMAGVPHELPRLIR